MNTAERDQLIVEKLNEGMSLSDVQKLLADKHGVNMTYFDLRLLAAELNVNWQKQEKQPKPEEAASPEDTLVDATAPAAGGATKVTISKLARPDAALSGTVEFASGASGQWYVDHYGRLGISPDKGSSKPTEDDLREFQAELQRQASGQG